MLVYEYKGTLRIPVDTEGFPCIFIRRLMTLTECYGEMYVGCDREVSKS